MGIPFYNPKPHAPAAFEGQAIPAASANPFSKLFFNWLSPILKVGYSRPLENEDLWTLQDQSLTGRVGDALEETLYSYLPPAQRPRQYRPSSKAGGKTTPSSSSDLTLSASDSTTKIASPTDHQYPPNSTRTETAHELTTVAGGKDEAGFSSRKVRYTLPLALAKVFKRSAWKCVIFHAIELALETTAPLLTQQLIRHVIVANAYRKAENTGSFNAAMRPPPLGSTIGIAIGLFSMMQVSSLFSCHYYNTAYFMGMFARQGVLDLIGRKSMRMSNKAKLQYSNGNLTTMLSSDAGYVENSMTSVFDILLLPIQIIIGVGLLIHLLGVSALVGLAVLILSTPLQGLLFRGMTKGKERQLKITDERTRLSNEVFNNIRVIKMYAWETLFEGRILEKRQKELEQLRHITGLRSTLLAMMNFLPTLAAVLTFITYALTGHSLDPATIFAALQLFSVLKTPLTMLPVSFSDLADARVALQRIGDMLRSDEGADRLHINLNARYAIEVEGNFTFEEPFVTVETPEKTGLLKRLQLRFATTKSPEVKVDEVEKEASEPFTLQDIDLRVPKGSLVCIVGRVGTGKSALLSGMLQELRQTKGHSLFGGSVSYVPQQAWIMSGSIRSNIEFGSSTSDETHLQNVIDACALRRDLTLMADGLETEIGEKGINLSGGQRQRVSLCRAAMSTTDIVLMDDPLSAVDAHVAKHIFENAILQGPFAARTRILVTHHLSVLPFADHIVVMDRADNAGRVVQQGSYQDLIAQDGVFQEMVKDHQQDDEPGSEKDASAVQDSHVDEPSVSEDVPAAVMKIFEDESRKTGAVSWGMYKDYARSMASPLGLFLFSLLLLFTIACNVGSTLFLGFWSGQSISGFKQGHYIAVYGGLGVAQAIATFLGYYCISIAGLSASYKAFNSALNGVLRSPAGWFDQTPVGRIVSRLSKVIQMLDDRLPQQAYRTLAQLLTIFGTIGLVFYVFPYLGIMFVPLTIFYYLCGAFFNRTSREIKRLDSNLRSHIYAHFGEQLQGVSVIKAYQQQGRFAATFQEANDRHARAYIIFLVLYQWLAVRLDLCGNLLILGIALFAACTRDTTDPTKVGVVLTYTITSIALLSYLVGNYARVEQQMNGVERVREYERLASEAAPQTPHDPPAEQWPSTGRISFSNVELRFRKDLPLVLKGLTFDVRAGEKVGIVGRTGAGKSSLAQALFRSVELAGGSINIDGQDLRQIGLDTLRSRLAIIPQDGFLFAGTVRENIDPAGLVTDADLNEALRRSGLVPDPEASGDLERYDKYKLDSLVADEGGNYSAGEKQLLALARAIVKNSKVLLMDEATSSVDAQTDAVIQSVIQTELSNVTLLCIAHRLQTIAYYDRILVLDAGEVAEYDEPLVLFDRPGSAFRSLCDNAKMTRDNIVKLRAAAALARQNPRAAKEAVKEAIQEINEKDIVDEDIDIELK